MLSLGDYILRCLDISFIYTHRNENSAPTNNANYFGYIQAEK